MPTSGCGPPQSNNQGVSDQPLSLSSSLLFDQFDDEGRWTGALSARNVLTLPTDKATELCGPAGAIVLLHCRVVHGSVADYSSRTGVLVRGRESAHVHMESYSARLPPRWDQVGYRSIFTAQTATSRPAWID